MVPAGFGKMQKRLKLSGQQRTQIHLEPAFHCHFNHLGFNSNVAEISNLRFKHKSILIYLF
jgi:hypothetical protein